MAYETGRTVIDLLKICYVADSDILSDLKYLNPGQYLDFGDFIFRRTTSHHFQYAYDVYTGETGDIMVLATARFGRYGDSEESGYFFYRVANRVLYDRGLLEFTLSIPESLGMVFHNFTAMDIAIDTKTDMALMMKRLWHRDDITTIINGKAVRDRKAVVKNLNLVYSTSLDRMKYLTVNVKQAKAAHDKTKGITVQAYNKMREIEESSHKDYIREYYGNPKRLYRLEVRLNNAEIQDYCRRQGITPGLDMVYDEDMLSGIFYYHLSSVIRYTKGREKLDWKYLIARNGKV